MLLSGTVKDRVPPGSAIYLLLFACISEFPQLASAFCGFTDFIGGSAKHKQQACFHGRTRLQATFPNGTSAGEATAGKDVQPLHHADILVRDDMAMRHKAADRLRLKINPKGDGSDEIVVDIWLRTVGAVGIGFDAGTMKVSCHSGGERGMLFTAVTKNGF